MSDPIDSAARASPARATLMVGSVETEYLRCGTGAPVIVLAPALAAAVREGRVPAVWERHRLLVPERTVPRAPFATWLRGMIDGLGLPAIIVVAPPSLEDDVRTFAAENPGEVVRVVVDRTAEEATDG